MNTDKYLIIVVLLFVLSVIISCSYKNPTPIEGWEDQYPPEFVYVSIQIPEPLKLSGDSMAQTVVGYIDMFNEMKKYVPLLNPSADTSLAEYKISGSSIPWVLSWRADEGFLILLFITKEGTSYNWELKFWGEDTTKNKFYDKWIVLSAYNDLEGKGGGITLYEENSKNIDSYYSWYTYPSTVKNYRAFQISKHTDDDIDFIVEITYNYDLSGELSKYSMGEEKIYVEFKCAWSLSGQGEWWRYNENHNIVASGSW